MVKRRSRESVFVFFKSLAALLETFIGIYGKIMKTWRDRFESCTQLVSSRWFFFLAGASACGVLVAVATVAFLMGASSRGPANLSEAVLHATASHGSTNVAVATGQVSEDAEGIFILDYLTGNLQCRVFYPRMQRFGGKFGTNITAQLPGTKNAEYLLVTGNSNTTQVTGQARPAGCIVYVVDTKSGLFAAYSLPWNRQAEMAGEPQEGMISFLDGGQYRLAAGGSSSKKMPVPTKEPEKAKTTPK